MSMRNQPLTGYLLHQKPYQEKRALYYFFSESHGLVHGVGKKGMLLFTPLTLFATGKRSLKTFSQVQPLNVLSSSDKRNESNPFSHLNESQTIVQPISQPLAPPKGQNLYAGFYLNEILWQLLASEDVVRPIWQAYQHCLHCLQYELSMTELKLLLRQFEYQLFNELGYAIDYGEDSQGQSISTESYYQFVVNEGFHRVDERIDERVNEKNGMFTNPLLKGSYFLGRSLQAVEQYLHHPVSDDDDKTIIQPEVLQDWSRLHKQMIDFLLDYKPLKSRELWQQFYRYRVVDCDRMGRKV